MGSTATIERVTGETRVRAAVTLYGSGKAKVNTGIGFLDHMLTTLAKHSGFDLVLQCSGDLHIDDHHTAEDCALSLGAALDEVLGQRRGIARFGSAYAPLDESLSRVVVDLCGRPWPEVHLNLCREKIGGIATENVTHFFRSFAMASRSTLHVDVLRGDNDHHKIESAFKGLALALRAAVAPVGSEVLSTKGVLS